MVYWKLPDGRQFSDEEYQELQLKEDAAKKRATEDAARLIAQLSEAYKACSGFLNSHPELCYRVGDAEAAEHDLYQKLRRNLERADEAPRCEKVREDGTVCGCPQMKGYRYCYAHERMLQARPEKLELPALEDANGIQLAIMMVQKALIDDEISEKKAGLLLYSLQIAASNVKQTTFSDEYEKEMVTEMPEEEAFSSQHSALSQCENQNLKTYHGDTEAQRATGLSGDQVIGKSGDLGIRGSGGGRITSLTREPRESQQIELGALESTALQITDPLTAFGNSR